MFTEAQFKSIANKLHTLIEIRTYSKYGFKSISYMTDMFGGTYANFHIDLNTGVTTLDYGMTSETIIEDIDTLENTVKSRMDKMIEERDLEEIYNLINSEY